MLIERSREFADRIDRALSAIPPGRDELGRQAVEDDVDHWLPLQRLLEHDPGTTIFVHQEAVDQQERIARAGVPAEHQQWRLSCPRDLI